MPDDEPKAPTPGEGGDNQPLRSQVGQIARYSHLAFALPAATFAGWLVGAAIDKWLKTTWVNKVGLALGVIAGFLELVRGYLRLKDEG